MTKDQEITLMLKRQIARDCRNRITQQIGAGKLTPKKAHERTDAAIDFLAGAVSAANALLGEDHKDTKAIMMMAYLVSVRGWDQLEEIADATLPKNTDQPIG